MNINRVCICILKHSLCVFCLSEEAPHLAVKPPIPPMGRLGSGGSGSECKAEGAFCNKDSECCQRNCRPGNFQGVCRARSRQRKLQKSLKILEKNYNPPLCFFTIIVFYCFANFRNRDSLCQRHYIFDAIKAIRELAARCNPETVRFIHLLQ